MDTTWRSFMTGLLIAAPSLWLAACGASHAEPHAPAAPSTPDAIPVSLSPVVTRPADAPLVVHGRVGAAREHKPAFKTGGVVEAILVDEGDRVAAGQVLARLDTRQLDAGLAQARAALGKAARDLARVEQLVGDEVLPGTDRDDARTAHTIARAQVSALAYDREKATLVATEPGVVIRRLAEPGEVVGPGAPVLVISGSEGESQRLEIGVPALGLDRVRPGARASVRLDGETVDRPATVLEIAPTLTPGTDRLMVTLAFEGDAPLGIVGSATFAPRAELTLPAVPITTLVEGLGREATVWIPDPDRPGRVHKRTITIARIDADGMALVAAGLDGVGAVIDAGNAWLDEDATITIEEARHEAR